MKRPGRAWLDALCAGLTATVAVILLSLPLKSPHDALMNSATIALSGAAVSLALALLWQRIAAGRAVAGSLKIFSVAGIAAFIAAVLASWLVQTVAELEGTVGFVTPLAATQFLVTVLLTPAFRKSGVAAPFIAVALAVAVVGLGAGLAGHGDQESGRLSLPPRQN